MIQYLHCSNCCKPVSTGFEPVSTDTPDKGIIVRAYIECPECMEKKSKESFTHTTKEPRWNFTVYGTREDINNLQRVMIEMRDRR